MSNSSEDEMSEIALSEYIVQFLASVEAFEKVWRDGMEADPEHFPAGMEPGDWDEQYFAHLRFEE
jgi:hypothetical protein